MIDRVGLLFGIGMVAGMCFTLLCLSFAVVLLTLHSKVKDKQEGNDEEVD